MAAAASGDARGAGPGPAACRVASVVPRSPQGVGSSSGDRRADPTSEAARAGGSAGGPHGTETGRQGLGPGTTACESRRARTGSRRAPRPSSAHQATGRLGPADLRPARGRRDPPAAAQGVGQRGARRGGRARHRQRPAGRAGHGHPVRAGRGVGRPRPRRGVRDDAATHRAPGALGQAGGVGVVPAGRSRDPAAAERSGRRPIDLPRQRPAGARWAVPAARAGPESARRGRVPDPHAPTPDARPTPARVRPRAVFRVVRGGGRLGGWPPRRAGRRRAGGRRAAWRHRPRGHRAAAAFCAGGGSR